MFTIETSTPQLPSGRDPKNTLYHVSWGNRRMTLAAFCKTMNLAYPTIRQRLIADKRLREPIWFTKLIKDAVTRRARKVERCAECGRPKLSKELGSKALVSRDGEPIRRLFNSADAVPLKGWPVVAEIFPATNNSPSLRVLVQDRQGKRWYHLAALCRAVGINYPATLRLLVSASLPQRELIDIQHFIWRKTST